MERNSSLKDVLTSVENIVKSKDSFSEQIKKTFTEFNEKFNDANAGKKLNLIMFGNVSVGKTNLINLMIRHLITQKNNSNYYFQTVENQQPAKISTTPNSENDESESDEEEEVEEEKYDGFVELSTREIENTYFACFIENSESDQYEIIITIKSEKDKEALIKLEAFNNSNFDSENQIGFKFSNDEEGIKKMNKFLKDIDYQCFNIIRKQKKVDMDYQQENQEEFIPSKMAIKIPNFPKELRLIDSPGLSSKSFRKAFIKMIYDLNYINFFLIVNDIYSRESYSITDDVLKEVGNDYGSPILYSFITKGEKFLRDFPKINKSYKAYVRTNNMLFKNLEDIKEKINFRKVIPINDKVYNEDVKKCLKVFFDDLDVITEEYGIANFEASVMLRLRNMIYEINNRISKEALFSEKKIRSLRNIADEELLNYEKEIRGYFEDLTSFNTFKNKYPDLLDELYEVYDKHEWKNDHGAVRSNYIKKHTELSFEDFQRIIFKKPEKLIIKAFDHIFNKADEDVKKRLISILSVVGLLDDNSTDVNKGVLLFSFSAIISGSLSMFSVSLFHLTALYLLGEGLGLTLFSTIFPIIGWVVGAVGLVITFSNVTGIWLKKNTREDITDNLLRWLRENKRKSIETSVETFKELMNNFLSKLTQSKVPDEDIKALLLQCDKFKPNSKRFPITDYKEELLNILENKSLRNFFIKVFEYKEEESQ